MVVSTTESVLIREARPDDQAECGRIMYEAFAAIADAHRFPRDFPSAEVGQGLAGMLISHPCFYGVVAERDGRILGSNFLDERSTIAGVGPITIDPEAQNRQVGRSLMNAVIDRARDKGFPGTRLLQVAYHNRSLSLYSKLGFEVREACVVMQGDPIGEQVGGRTVRPAAEADLAACDAVCFRVHGHDRSGELLDAIRQGTAKVVEDDGRITGYCTDIAYFAHAVGESNHDLKVLIGAATAFGGPGFILPVRNGKLFRWCLERNLRVVQMMTLMTIGLYNEPTGAYLPCILY